MHIKCYNSCTISPVLDCIVYSYYSDELNMDEFSRYKPSHQVSCVQQVTWEMHKKMCFLVLKVQEDITEVAEDQYDSWKAFRSLYLRKMKDKIEPLPSGFIESSWEEISLERRYAMIGREVVENRYRLPEREKNENTLIPHRKKSCLLWQTEFFWQFLTNRNTEL